MSNPNTKQDRLWTVLLGGEYTGDNYGTRALARAVARAARLHGHVATVHRIIVTVQILGVAR